MADLTPNAQRFVRLWEALDEKDQDALHDLLEHRCERLSDVNRAEWIWAIVAPVLDPEIGDHGRSRIRAGIARALTEKVS